MWPNISKFINNHLNNIEGEAHGSGNQVPRDSQQSYGSLKMSSSVKDQDY